jgi:hypothetical protein
MQYENIFVDYDNTGGMSQKPLWLFRSIKLTLLQSAVSP